VEPRAYVVEAGIGLGESADPAAVGAAVTVELCGRWDHDGPCRWPHNSEIDAERDPALFRTVYVASEPEEPAVRERIEASLRGGEGWSVVSFRARPVADSERSLADSLVAGSRHI
jgi:hypothetical protein